MSEAGVLPPLVSVVMGVYNSASTLVANLDSILAQQDVDFEFIVIDDGSTDATAQLLDTRAAADARLRVVHQPNAGLTQALVAGCALARGRFIARQDSDDVSLPGRLQAQAQWLQAHGDAVLVGCDYELVGPRGELLRVRRGQADGVADLLDRHGRSVPGPHHGTVMFRRDAYERAGGYRPAFYFAQDIDLWSRLLEVGELGYVPEVLCRVTFDPGSITGRHRAAQQRLRELSLQGAAARRAGASDEPFVQQAAAIRPQRGADSDAAARAQVAAAYFVASCLFDRADGRARGYLRDVVRQSPGHWRAWSKLLASHLRGHRYAR